MKRSSEIVGLVAAAILAANIASAKAEEPMRLNEAQMDQVTAGYSNLFQALMSQYSGPIYGSVYYGHSNWLANQLPRQYYFGSIAVTGFMPKSFAFMPRM